jgi:DNA-binding IclR family transcriptional regulator
MSRNDEQEQAAVATGSKRSRPAGVFAAKHTVDILRCISQAGTDVGVNEIARRVGLHKSSVSRLIVTLETERLVERNPETDRFKLGIGLMALAAPLLMERGVASVSRPHMSMLAQRSGETVNLSVWNGREAISVEQALGTNAITHYAAPGQSNPAHCSASGKLLLAFASPAEAEAILSGKLEKFTEYTVIDPAALRSDLASIRHAGCAINCGEFKSDVGAVAAAVRDMNGHALGAIVITVPMYRFDQQRQGELLTMVRATADDISAQMGFRLAASAFG